MHLGYFTVYLNHLQESSLKKKCSVYIFGYNSSLKLPIDSPLYGKLTFSLDGYFFDNEKGDLILIEFKCPHTRQIVRGSVPEHYLDQVQTGLHLSELNKAVCVDSCLRICSWIQLKTGMNHNSCFNRGKLPASLKRDTPFAWGVCILFTKYSSDFDSDRLLNLGAQSASFERFSKIMQRIAEKDLWCSYGKVRLSFSEKDINEEHHRLLLATRTSKKHSQNTFEGGFPLAFFVWKLFDYTTISVTKDPHFFNNIQRNVEIFFENNEAVTTKIREFIQEPHLAQSFFVEPKKQEIVNFTGGDSEIMNDFLLDNFN